MFPNHLGNPEKNQFLFLFNHIFLFELFLQIKTGFEWLLGLLLLLQLQWQFELQQRLKHKFYDLILTRKHAFCCCNFWSGWCWSCWGCHSLCSCSPKCCCCCGCKLTVVNKLRKLAIFFCSLKPKRCQTFLENKIAIETSEVRLAGNIIFDKSSDFVFKITSQIRLESVYFEDLECMLEDDLCRCQQ